MLPENSRQKMIDGKLHSIVPAGQEDRSREKITSERDYLFNCFGPRREFHIYTVIAISMLARVPVMSAANATVTFLTQANHPRISSLSGCSSSAILLDVWLGGLISPHMVQPLNAYINHRNDPGGPLVYSILTFSTSLVVVGNNVCPIISIFLTDALLVWRLYIIWGIIWVLVLPIVMLIASTVMGIFLIISVAQPGNDFNSALAVKFGTAYFSISLSLTVIVTLTIVFRLLYLQRLVSKALGNAPEYRDHYISASTILLESSALHAVVGFIFLILYNRNVPASNIFVSIMVQVMCISSDLIILKVAIGSAWTARASGNITSLAFNSSTETKSVPGSRLNVDTEAGAP
ncbi:hypothetical protein B0H13DRAFT_2267474 [Mycena leptocephala]|nr:hypothetical protein B0H13DRAFT_2267474 [Mycena leptocephala]